MRQRVKRRIDSEIIASWTEAKSGGLEKEPKIFWRLAVNPAGGGWSVGSCLYVWDYRGEESAVEEVSVSCFM